MIRLRFWRSVPQSDALDPELQALFATKAHPPVLDTARLASGRARVATQLRPSAVPAAAAGGRLQKRLAFGLVGGGGLWAALAGTAAAHKAATAVAVGVVLAGAATTAEVTGIGPAVRDAVTSSGSRNSEPAVTAISGAQEAQAGLDASATPNPNAAVVEEAPEGVPGNLVTQVRPDGSFSLRGVLVSVTGTQIAVLTSVDDVPLVFDLGSAEVRIPGAGSAQGGPNAQDDEPSLAGYEDYLVRITGQCELVDGALTEDCDLSTVQILGNAGQDSPDDEAGTATESESETNGPPDHANNPEGTGPPEDRGKPDDPGNPNASPEAD